MEVVKDRREGRATGAAAAEAMYDEDTGRRVQKSKMRQQDVAGSIRMDRQDLRMAELQLLFQVRASLITRALWHLICNNIKAL